MIRPIQELLTTEYHGNMIQDYVAALLITILIFVILYSLSYLFKNMLKKIDEKKPEKPLFSRKILEALSWPLFLVIGLSIASISLEQTEIVSQILTYVLSIVITIYVTKLVVKIISYVSKKIITRNENTENLEDTTEPAVIELYAKLLSILA
ncbi:MAG: hypothetical protein ACLFN8_01060 [Candidatus Woesearchaeota archaeon]